MKINPTKKLLKKFDKFIPASSEYLFEQTRTKLKKKDRVKLDFLSGMYQWLSENDKSKPAKRKPFSKLTRKKVQEYQQNRCKLCGKKSDHFDFDHIDGNSSNNDVLNCQALCPNCHAEKTRKKIEKNQTENS